MVFGFEAALLLLELSLRLGRLLLVRGVLGLLLVVRGLVDGAWAAQGRAQVSEGDFAFVAGVGGGGLHGWLGMWGYAIGCVYMFNAREYTSV